MPAAAITTAGAAVTFTATTHDAAVAAFPAPLSTATIATATLAASAFSPAPAEPPTCPTALAPAALAATSLPTTQPALAALGAPAAARRAFRSVPQARQRQQPPADQSGPQQ